MQYGNCNCLFSQSSLFKVATIRGNIDKIAQDVEQVKKMHSAMLSAAVQEQGIKNNTPNWLISVYKLSLKGVEMISANLIAYREANPVHVPLFQL